MAVKEQIYQIDGFIFYGQKEAEQAKKEAAGVEYLKAKIDIDKLDNGDILIADSSVNVPQDKMWCTQASADKFRAAFNEAEALLIKHKTEPQSDDRLSSQDTALTRAITQFKTYSGSYAVIQNITFKNPTQILPLGDSQTFTATCTPARPTRAARPSPATRPWSASPSSSGTARTRTGSERSNPLGGKGPADSVRGAGFFLQEARDLSRYSKGVMPVCFLNVEEKYMGFW